MSTTQTPAPPDAPIAGWPGWPPQAPQPPRRTPWWKHWYVFGAAALIAVGGIASAASGSHPAAAQHPQTSISAPASPASAPASPATSAPATLAEQTLAWLNGPGGKAAEAWAAAANNLGDNPTAAQLASLRSLGQTAEANPCPVDPADYQAMFGAMDSAIQAMQDGDYSTALNNVTAALQYASAWESAVSQVTGS